MIKVVKKVPKKILKIINNTIKELKPYIEINDYTYYVNENYDDSIEIAEIKHDLYENEFTINISEKLSSFNLVKIKSVIAHEIIHGLYSFYMQQAKTCGSQDSHYYFEEKFINVIERMIARYMGWKNE